MTSPEPPLVDNRRAVLRVVTHDILRTLRSLAKLHDGDMLALIIFTTIWSFNGEHLIGDSRYAGLRDIGPDSTSKPIPLAQLQKAVGVPRELLDSYLETLIAQGLVEHVPGGLSAPRAAFASPEMMDAAIEVYDRLIGMVAALRAIGVPLGENAPST